MSRRRSEFVLHRRELLRGSAALGVASLPILACAEAPPAAGRGLLIAGDTCPVTPRQTEGPFYSDARLVRQDIREGRPGVPLTLRLQVVEAADCATAERARVDIWHCDAVGTYSGYDSERSAGETFLRGTQFTGSDGVATFRTIFPGWYGGRATHVHCKAWLPDWREVTSQIYFPDTLFADVYAEGAYAGRRGRAPRNEEDGLFRSAGERAPLAQMAKTRAGYDGAVVLALA